jgi:broad specificity phosphatase PhoE
MGDQLVVMLGTHPVCLSTVEDLKRDCENLDSVTFMHIGILNDLRAGEFDKMTFAEIKRKFPEIWEERMKDKLHFRFPGNGGESYVDLIQRLRPIIVELERQRKSVLVVGHLAVQRCIRAYFDGVPSESLFPDCCVSPSIFNDIV